MPPWLHIKKGHISFGKLGEWGFRSLGYGKHENHIEHKLNAPKVHKMKVDLKDEGGGYIENQSEY